MLVIHGKLDHRVPIKRFDSGPTCADTACRRSSSTSPDENHWILKPGNITLWYQTVFAWLDHQVLGEPWRRPDLV